jgi:predicted transcriptional regulator
VTNLIFTSNLNSTVSANLGYDPSLKVISRIMKVLLEKNSISKTNLSQECNIQYARLVKHLEWLEARNLIGSKIIDGKICINLSSPGRTFLDSISIPNNEKIIT